MTSVHLNIDRDFHQSNIVPLCSNLEFCNKHGQCVVIHNRTKCV